MPTYLARATARQVEANRRNALRSTGPKTEEGRAKSAANSTRHGLCARIVTGVNPAIAGEDGDEYLALLNALRDDLKPRGQMEDILVDRAAQLSWKLRRIPLAEEGIAQQMIAPKQKEHECAEHGRRKTPFVAPDAGELLAETLTKNDAGAFERLQMYEQRIERQLHSCLNQLRYLRKMKGEQGDNSEHHWSADLGIQDRGPRIDTNAHESEKSDALRRGPGVSSVQTSPQSLSRNSGVSPGPDSPRSLSSNEESEEGRDERTGGTPGPRRSGDTGWKPVLRGGDDVSSDSSIREDSCEFVDETLSASSDNAVEQTKPIFGQPVETSEVTSCVQS